MTHQSVFLELAVSWLQVRPGKWYLDATFGSGGHTAAILAAGGKVLALDFGPEAIRAGQKRFERELKQGRLFLERANFAHLPQVLKRPPPRPALSGALFDLGTSSEQLLSSERGLSFQGDGPLDMRLDPDLSVTAADLLQVLEEKKLMTLFYEYGGETFARPLARAIVKKRQSGALERTSDLVALINQVKKNGRGKIHPATKVFQALRIVVNGELDNLAVGLPQAFSALSPRGRLVVIAFHEGEDRIVKQYFRAQAAGGVAKLLTKKPLRPNEQELSNPRSRSAKLRVLEKL